MLLFCIIFYYFFSSCVTVPFLFFVQLLHDLVAFLEFDVFVLLLMFKHYIIFVKHLAKGQPFWLTLPVFPLTYLLHILKYRIRKG